MAPRPPPRARNGLEERLHRKRQRTLHEIRTKKRYKRLLLREEEKGSHANAVQSNPQEGISSFAAFPPQFQKQQQQQHKGGNHGAADDFEDHEVLEIDVEAESSGSSDTGSNDEGGDGIGGGGGIKALGTSGFRKQPPKPQRQQQQQQQHRLRSGSSAGGANNPTLVAHPPQNQRLRPASALEVVAEAARERKRLEREAREDAQRQREAYYSRRREQRAVMTQRTRRGQPAFAAQIEAIYTKLAAGAGAAAGAAHQGKAGSGGQGQHSKRKG